jgi:peptide/nickel transport system permease protein
LLLLLLFSVTLQWLPGSVLDVMPGAPWYQRVPAYILPVATLAFGMTGGYIRYLRGSLREVLPMPYIRTAVAKGAARRRVLYGHALQNASLPAVTIVALSVGGLFSGALITETLFGINGLGRLVYEAINGNDYNLAIAALLLSTACVLLCNLIADLLYAWLDPRISHAG